MLCDESVLLVCTMCGCSCVSVMISTPNCCVSLPPLLTTHHPCLSGVSMLTAGAGHITNYAQNENGDVWDLRRLAQHMGQTAWQVGVEWVGWGLGLTALLGLARTVG